MSKQKKCFLVLLLTFVMLFTFSIPTFAATKVENTKYHSYAAFGDSIAAGYGPLLNNYEYSDFYYCKPPTGAYPNLLTKTLGLDLDKDFNSMLCVDQRVVDAYYACGGNIDKVFNPADPSIDMAYLDDARNYHSAAYMEVLEGIHNSGEGAERVKNSDLVTIQIGFADITIYPIRKGRESELFEGTDADGNIIISDEFIKYFAKLELACLNQYMTYYPKLIKQIKKLNPNAKIMILSDYNPFEKFVTHDESDQKVAELFQSAIKLANIQLKLWAALYGCSYVDISDLGDYVDYKTTDIETGKFIESMIDHENHPGAAGHQYVENQILNKLGLKRGSKVPSLDDESIYLAFSSDVHLGNDGKASTRLDQWLDNVSEDLGGITFEQLGLCGDYAADDSWNESYQNKIQIIMNTVEHNAHVENGIYTVGQQEYTPGDYVKKQEYAPFKELIRVGEAANTDDYQIFCLGASSEGTRFNDDDITALSDYLENAETGKPVFIMSHFPIHTYADIKTGNANKMVNLLNQYPNVVFVWGHNHDVSDPHYGTVYTEELDGMPINFTYCSAGCMSDADYSEGSGNISAKGLVAKINGHKLELSYYNKDYQRLSSYAVQVDNGIASADQTYPERDEQPEIISDYKSATKLEDNAWYVISFENQALVDTAHDGYIKKNDAGALYKYSGLDGSEITINGNYITSKVTKNMLWKAIKTDGGFAFTNKEGKYLRATYNSNSGGSEFAGTGNIYTGDEPEIWEMKDGGLRNVKCDKYLNYQTPDEVEGTLVSGEFYFFTVRSHATDMVNIFRALNGDGESVYDDEVCQAGSALYKATTGCNVSISSETIGEGESFKGSTAIVKNGYTFDGWYKDGEKISDNETFTPTETGIYEARTVEETATITYEERYKDDVSHSASIGVSEKVKVVTGKPVGCIAPNNESKGLEFLYWTSDVNGTKIISRNEKVVPQKVNGIYSDTTYYAWYKQKSICFCIEKVESTELEKGTHGLQIDGYECGEFVFTKHENKWTIYDVEKRKYVVLNKNNNLDYSNTLQDWTFNNSKFSITIKKKFLIWPVNITYYLTCARGELRICLIPPWSTKFVEEARTEYPEHLIDFEKGRCVRCGEEIK